jgi:Na+/H+-dicarboxylate symporter/ABC-type amino acid transport substrate-binding protein
MSAQPPKKRRKRGLATRVFIGLGLGILVGLFFGDKVAFLKTAGDAFIALLQITVIPYVVIALSTSLGKLTLVDAKALGIKAGTVLLALWAVGLMVVLLGPLAFPTWPSSTFFSASQIEAPRHVDFLQLYIPSNIFAALANATVPAIVVFSILLGLALISVESKRVVLDFMSSIGDAMMTITVCIGNLAPFGVFAITASAAGTIDIADAARLQVYIVVYVAMVAVLSFWLIPALIATLTPLKYGDILRAFHGPLATAFATGNVLIVLPLLAAESKELLANTGKESNGASETELSSVDILIPASFPFPNLGVILALLFVPFGGWYVGQGMSVGDYPLLSVAGIASLFGGTVLALPFLFDLFRLPADLFHVFVTVDVVGSRFGTLLAALHIIAITLIGTFALQGRIRFRMMPFLRFAVLSVLITAATLAGIRAFYTYAYVAPYTKRHLLMSLHSIDKPVPHRTYRTPPEAILNETGGPLSFERFKERGVLRACYQPEDYPSAFFNDDGELVGFDIEMTHHFASYLGFDVEFLPIRSVSDAAKRINTRYCDVIMSLLPIEPLMTEKFAMTAPVLNVPVGLIVVDYRRNEFRDWAGIREKTHLRVAIINNALARRSLRSLLPNATPVLYENTHELDRILAAGAKDVDAVGIYSEEGAAWTIRYPQFTLVTPTPTVFMPVGYAVALRNTRLLQYLDTWLLNAKARGTIDEIYRYWMLGQVKKTQPPRWSVIRNVLGWVD